MLFPRRVLRKRSASQVWSGAVATINAHINRVGSRITVKAPLCVRSAGRYDMELNHTVAQPITDSAKSVIEFVQYFLNKRGSVKTHNVMLSEPGSARQPIHTDSNWDGHPQSGSKATLFYHFDSFDGPRLGNRRDSSLSGNSSRY